MNKEVVFIIMEQINKLDRGTDTIKLVQLSKNSMDVYFYDQPIYSFIITFINNDRSILQGYEYNDLEYYRLYNNLMNIDIIAEPRIQLNIIKNSLKNSSTYIRRDIENVIKENKAYSVLYDLILNRYFSEENPYINIE